MGQEAGRGVRLDVGYKRASLPHGWAARALQPEPRGGRAAMEDKL